METTQGESQQQLQPVNDTMFSSTKTPIKRQKKWQTPSIEVSPSSLNTLSSKRTSTHKPSGQYEQILKLLKANPKGVYNYELNRIAFRYSAIIHRMRGDGWDIQTEKINSGLYKFYLGDNE